MTDVPLVEGASVDGLLRAYHERGDLAARDRLVEQHLPLVRSLARRYAGRGEPLEDLVQVGSIGLIKAVDRFDVDRGVEFTSYAVPTIVGEIRRHFRDKAWAIHVPRRLKELSLLLSRLLDELTNELGRSPTVAELAEKFRDFVDVLAEIRDSGKAAAIDVLRLYEVWLKTGSRRAARLLREHGLEPNATLNVATRH